MNPRPEPDDFLAGMRGCLTERNREWWDRQIALCAASDHKERARMDMNLARLTKKAGGSLYAIKMYARDARRAWRLAMHWQRKAEL